MSVLRLEDASDLSDPRGRGQLNDERSLIANKLRLLEERLSKVLDADKIVRPVPIEAFPMAAGQVYTGEEGGEIGDITWRAVEEAPAGTLPCDGAAVSRTTYSDLFAKISTTFGVGNGSTTFNVPDLARRVAVGVGGSGTATLDNDVGDTGGAETVTLGTGEIPSHVHEHAHTHPIPHTHDLVSYSNPGAGALGPGPQSATAATNSASRSDLTGGSNTANSGTSSTSDTNNTGGGGAHNNMQPSLVLAPYVRFRLGPTDTIQTLPISWGGVNAQWRLGTLKSFPATSHSNLHTTVTYANRPDAPARPGAVVRISGASGTQVGTNSENKIIGVLALPHSFRKWTSTGLRIATKLNMTGVSGTATVTLKVSDPVTAGAYLANQYSRTLTASGSAFTEAYFVDARLTGEDLGRDWKPGYLMRFELLWTVPNTFTSATLDVGFMEVGWA